MDMEEKKMMKIVSNDGSSEDVEVVFAFEFKDTKKEYVIYTKNERDEDNNITVYVSNVDRSNHHRMARAVAGVATAAVGMPNMPSSSVERPLEYDLDTVSSRGYGELADVMPPQYDMNLPVMRGAYIAYLSSLLGQAKNALDGLYQTEVYQRDVAEYDRQVDEANENYQFQPRLTKALRAEMQIKRRISELERRINDLKRMDDATNNP